MADFENIFNQFETKWCNKAFIWNHISCFSESYVRKIIQALSLYIHLSGEISLSHGYS